jgi:hypothetical protein
MIVLSTDAAMNTPEWIEWKRKHALRYAMQKWATDNHYEQVDMCVKLEHELGVPDSLMARVHARRNWYLLPNNSYERLEAYIDATRGAALVADVRVYQAEVAAAKAAHRKRRSEELKAERAAEPPVLARAQPARASKRTPGRAACDVFLLKGAQGARLCVHSIVL